MTTDAVEREERILVQRAARGSVRAFGTLVERYMRRAYFVALALVGTHDDALDLSQEAFARAFRAWTTLDPDRPFYPWYYQILRRLCLNFLRDRSTRAAAMTRMTPWLAENAAGRAHADRLDRQAERRELREQLVSAIDALPAREREAFVLKEFDGRTYAEIAELVGIPRVTVMSRLYAARRRLARGLEGHR